MSIETWIGRLSVAIAVGCATAVTVTAVALTMPSVRQTFLGLGPKPSYAAGQFIDLPPEVFQQTAHTVVVLFRPDCGACARLKPYLTRLAARSRASVRIVAVTGVADPTDAVAFLNQIGLDQSSLVTMNLETVRVRTVPTVALVDRSGRIETVFEGIPPIQIEEDLLRQVAALAQSR